MIPDNCAMRFGKTMGTAISLIALCLLCMSCSHAKKSEERFDVYIQLPEDVKKLDQIESSLALTPEKALVHPDFQNIKNIPVPNLPEYRIGPADVIEIVYHIRYEKTPDEYRLEVQDKISISFPYHPQFSSTVLVRTDGKITVPLVGDVAAASKTPRELAAILNRMYSRYLQDPSITVALEEFNVKIEELKKAITTAPRGQSKIAPVTPDGRISFPIVGNIQAEGLTLSQLEKIVNEKYSQYIRNLDATLILLEIHHPKLYVLGEVERPGAYEMTSRLGLLDAFTLAGGYKKSAYLKEVIVFRNDGLEKPIAFKVDLEPVLKQGYTYAGLDLKPADIIYVPKSKLDRFNDLVEKIFAKGLYTIAPFSTVFSVNYDVKSLR